MHFHGLMWMQVHLLVWSACVSVGSEVCICPRELCRRLREEGAGALRWEQNGDGGSVRRGKGFGVCSGEMFYQHHSGYWVENWLGDTSRSRETSEEMGRSDLISGHLKKYSQQHLGKL